jgi:putative NADH-flavin reductase
MTMRLAVFGATGHVGRHHVDQALAAGHEVTALVRDPARLPARDGLTVVPGAVQDSAAVARTVAGADAVLSALGTRKPWGGVSVCADGMRAVLPAMRTHGVRRLVVVGCYGTGEGRRKDLYYYAMSLAIRQIMRDKNRQDELIRAADEEWTIVCPAVLGGGTRTGRVRAGTDLRLGLLSRISYADVAGFMLDEAGKGEYVRKAVAITA